ncbi:hypothetical protein JCM6882_009406 [Rhodosporidiobolus microsporus]
MSSSIVHLSLAAASGLVLGAAGALTLNKPKQPQSPPSSAAPAPPAPGGAPVSALPAAGLRNDRLGVPAQVVNGGLAVGELKDRVLNGGTIGPISDLLLRTSYTTAYDRRNRIPAWTVEHLTAASLKSGGGDRAEAKFREDESVPEMWRARLLDYFKSGYDRGHMVPAADAKQSQQAMSETFLLTNIAPQVGEGFNRHYWAYLEAFCRNLTTSFDDVYVFTVPLFLPKRDPRDGKWRVTYEMIAPQGGPPSIAVPTHFAKVLLASRAHSSSLKSLVPASNKTGDGKEWVQGAFVLPNEAIPDEARLEGFVVPVEAVERSSGLSLLPAELKLGGAGGAKELCKAIKCEVVVRRFDDAQKKLGGGKGGQQQQQRRVLHLPFALIPFALRFRSREHVHIKIQHLSPLSHPQPESPRPPPPPLIFDSTTTPSLAAASILSALAQLPDPSSRVTGRAPLRLLDSYDLSDLLLAGGRVQLHAVAVAASGKGEENEFVAERLLPATLDCARIELFKQLGELPEGRSLCGKIPVHVPPQLVRDRFSAAERSREGNIVAQLDSLPHYLLDGVWGSLGSSRSFFWRMLRGGAHAWAKQKRCILAALPTVKLYITLQVSESPNPLSLTFDVYLPQQRPNGPFRPYVSHQLTAATACAVTVPRAALYSAENGDEGQKEVEEGEEIVLLTVDGVRAVLDKAEAGRRLDAQLAQAEEARVEEDESESEEESSAESDEGGVGCDGAE